MMRPLPTLTLYIARLYATNIALLALLLALFTVTIDAFINLNQFMAAGERLATAADAGGGGGEAAGDPPGQLRVAMFTVWAVLDLWWPRLLQLFNYLSGLLLVGGLGFTGAQLVRQREIVAVLASGISLFRVSGSFFVVAAIVLGAQVLNQELVIPTIAQRLIRTDNDLGRPERSLISVRLNVDERGSIWHAAVFEPESGMLKGLNIWLRDERARVLGHLTADAAVWDPGTNGGQWTLENGWYHAASQTDDPQLQSIGSRGVPLQAYQTKLDPTRLRVKWLEGFGGNLSWRQITAMLRAGGLEPESAALLERARWGRIGAVLSNALVLIASMPLFLLRTPRGLLSATLRAAPIAAMGLLAAAAAPTLAYPGVPPAIGALIPTLALLPVAWGMYTGMKS
jgi:lipopolysaccharide export system permease protein